MENEQAKTAQEPVSKGMTTKPSRAKRAAKVPNEIVGHVENIALDLSAEPQRGLTFVIAQKSGKPKTIALEATGEARQAAIALLLASKVSGKKLSVAVVTGSENVLNASAMTFKSKPRKKD